MSIIDEILAKRGLKFEDLTLVEKETLNTWLDILKKSDVTIDKIRTYILSMRDAVEEELTKVDHKPDQDIFLKARLRNYMLLQAFLTSPEKARQAIERSLGDIKTGKG